MGWRLCLSDLDLGQEEVEAVMGVLSSKWLSMGPVTRNFEEAFASYLGVKHAVAVSNGTVALHLACLSLDIGAGDEVIVPSLTFVATANAVLYTGARPVFVDIVSPDNLNISPESIRSKITSRTKAIIVVHYGGYPADMDEILELAGEHNLKVIEDAAHAPGAAINGKKAGTLGDVGCFSFFANKNLPSGEGGMVVTGSDQLAERIKSLRSHGMTSLTWDRHRGHAFSYDITDLGYNYRISEIESAIGLAQLKKIEKNNLRRRNLSELYYKQLKGALIVSPAFINHPHTPACHIFPVLLEPEADRQNFMNTLKENGIQTSIHYPPVHLFSYYRKNLGCCPGMLPVTEYVGGREVTLPLHPLMTEEDVKTVAGVVRSCE